MIRFTSFFSPPGINTGAFTDVVRHLPGRGLVDPPSAGVDQKRRSMPSDSASCMGLHGVVATVG